MMTVFWNGADEGIAGVQVELYLETDGTSNCT